jgi:hypothetical protein
VRIVGVILFLVGAAATAYATLAMYRRRRPRDVLFAIAAPVTFVVAVLGLVLAFVPGFLD